MIPSPCNILIGMATGGTVRSETVTSLFGALEVLKSHGVGVNLAIEIGGYVAHNRNALVKTAREKGMDYIMFIDNDMVFQPSSIQRLLDADKNIIGCNYNARGVPGKPIISTVKMVDPNTDPNYGKTMTVEFPAQMFKVFGLGTGFMLIKTKVFEKLEKPYFEAYEDPDGSHHTEDIEFCARAHKKGFNVWCNPTIKLGHIGTQEY